MKKLLSKHLVTLLVGGGILVSSAFGYQEGTPLPLEPMPIFIPSLTYRGGDGISYQAGYESLGTFFALYRAPYRNYPFIDTEFLRVDDGHFAGTGGVGWRFFSKDYTEMVGINLFYDWRFTQQKSFHQIGIGAELLGRCWDLRCNGYIPVGEKTAVIDTTVFSYPPDYTITRQMVDTAMWGLDLEVGTSVFNKGCFCVYGALGPYFYACLCSNTLLGGSGRLAVKVQDYFTLQLLVSHDTNFGTHVQGEIRISFLFPRKAKGYKCLFPPVWRNRVMILNHLPLWDTNF